MSLQLELAGKAGHVCPPGFKRIGPCPLLVRPTSEDVLTSTVFGVLKNLPPEKWLTPWLNRAFRTTDFDQASFQDLRFEFWPALPPPPKFRRTEGVSKADMLIHFDDIVVGCEVKFHAGLSPGTAHNPKRNQLLRYVDVLAHHFGGGKLFKRRLYVLTLTATPEPLARRYQDTAHLESDLEGCGYGQRAAQEIANAVSVGSSTWSDLGAILAAGLPVFDSAVEESFVLDVLTYLAVKLPA